MMACASVVTASRIAAADEEAEQAKMHRIAMEMTLRALVFRAGTNLALDLPFLARNMGRLAVGPPGSVGTCEPRPRAPEQAPLVADPSNPETIIVRGDGIGTTQGQPKVVPTELPPWPSRVAVDAACEHAGAQTGSVAYLLAWNVIEDERPLRNHNVAYAVAHRPTRDGREPWSIVVMYRHANNDWWNVAWSFHSRARPVHHFRERPTRVQVDQVLEENDWQFEREHQDFRLLAGNVIDEVWPVVTGDRAVKLHPPNVER